MKFTFFETAGSKTIAPHRLLFALWCLGMLLCLPVVARCQWEDLPGAEDGTRAGTPRRPVPAPSPMVTPVPSPGTAAMLGEVGHGFVSAAGTALNPLQSLPFLGQALIHPATVPRALGDRFGRLSDAYRSGDRRTLSRMLGQATFGATAAGLTAYLTARGIGRAVLWRNGVRAERILASELQLRGAKTVASELAATRVTLAPVSRAPVRLPALKVDPLYSGENAGKVMGGRTWNVDYLNQAQRAPYQLTVKNGRIYDATGKLFDTRTANLANGRPRALFVLDESGKFYATNKYVHAKVHHSSIAADLAGRPVMAAGEMEVHRGILKFFGDRSGHYIPSPTHSAEALLRLRDNGVRLDNVFVGLEKSSNWTEFMRYLTSRASGI